MKAKASSEATSGMLGMLISATTDPREAGAATGRVRNGGVCSLGRAWRTIERGEPYATLASSRTLRNTGELVASVPTVAMMIGHSGIGT